MTFKFIKIIGFLGWLASTGCSSDLESEEQESDSIEGVKSKLKEMLPDSIKLVSVNETDIDGYFEVNFEGIEPLYVSDDGEYLISGDIYNAGDIIEIKPGEYSKFEAIVDTVNVVVKYPGAKNDKYLRSEK